MSYKPLPELAGPLYGKDPWPLRFHTHGFDAVCFNTLACSIVYNRSQFGTRKLAYNGQPYDSPSGPPPFNHWRDRWRGNHSIPPQEGRTFPGPVELEWTAMDGLELRASLDLDELFKDRIILHAVGRDAVKDAWLDAKSVAPVRPDILVEVNDRTVSIFMRALVATEDEQVPGNSHSHFRDDLMQVWTHTY
jgi:hypothetical protein